MVGGTDPTLIRSLTYVDVRGEANQERCIPISQWTGIRLEAIGIRRTDIPMVVEVQHMGDRPMAACTGYPGDDLDIGAIHPSQQKMTKKVVDEKQTDGYRYSACRLLSKAKTNLCLRLARQMGKSLIIASTQ